MVLYISVRLHEMTTYVCLIHAQRTVGSFDAFEINLYTAPHLKALSSGLESLSCYWHDRHQVKAGFLSQTSYKKKTSS